MCARAKSSPRHRRSLTRKSARFASIRPSIDVSPSSTRLRRSVTSIENGSVQVSRRIVEKKAVGRAPLSPTRPLLAVSPAIVNPSRTASHPPRQSASTGLQSETRLRDLSHSNSSRRTQTQSPQRRNNGKTSKHGRQTAEISTQSPIGSRGKMDKKRKKINRDFFHQRNAWVVNVAICA